MVAYSSRCPPHRGKATVCFNENGWIAEGTLTADDTYDFDYQKPIVQKALTDYLEMGIPHQGSFGNYQGRTAGAELKVVAMLEIQKDGQHRKTF